MKTLKNEYMEVFQFFKSHLWKKFLLSTFLFVIITLFFFLLFKDDNDSLYDMMDTIVNGFSSSGIFQASDTFTDSNIAVMPLILNNLKSCLVAIFMGMIPFLFLPVLSIFINAFVIGVLGAFLNAAGLGLNFFIMGLLPHGILELPALLLSLSMGFYLCMEITKGIRGKSSKVSFASLMTPVVQTYVLVVIPFIITAGFIETYITGYFMNLVY